MLIKLIANILKRIKTFCARKVKHKDFNINTIIPNNKPLVSANRALRRAVKQGHGITLNHRITQAEKDVWIWQLSHDKTKNERPYKE